MGAMMVLRQLDLLVLALALGLFLAAGMPLLGYVAGAGAWLGQRAIRALLAARAAASDDPRTVAGLVAGSMIGRGWLVALAIFGVGLADESAGLAAAVLFIAVFSVWFAVGLALRPFEASR